MKYLSLCSGIEAASVAWRDLNWKPAAFAEIDAFPSAVLKHHYPHVPNLGDMSKFKEWPDFGPIDVICGGTPCQSFSNAGLRKGLDDPHGNLMLTFGAIVAAHRPQWVVFENVPGLLSSGAGRDFASLLGLLSGQCIEPPERGWQSAGFVEGIPDAYGLAWRVLDAQFVRVDGYPRAVPQRRNRVFVVGCLGDWRSAAAVLLERESLRGDPAPRRQAGSRVAATLTRGAESSGKGGYAGRRQEDDVNIVAGALAGTGPGAAWRIGADEAAANQLVAMCLNAKGGAGRMDGESETLIPTNGGVFDIAPTITATIGEQTGQDAMNLGLVAHTLRADGFDASEDGTGRGTPLVPVLPFDTTQITSPMSRANPQYGDPCHTLSKGMHAPTIAFKAGAGAKAGSLAESEEVSPTLGACPSGNNSAPSLLTSMQVRRLTPTEAERLMGFPDGYTAITWRRKPAPDGPRYKALGNSWAINCARWVGRRIAIVDSIRKAAP